jgi:hypothetical protein
MPSDRKFPAAVRRGALRPDLRTVAHGGCEAVIDDPDMVLCRATAPMSSHPDERHAVPRAHQRHPGRTLRSKTTPKEGGRLESG